jgi:hypothetical protein
MTDRELLEAAAKAAGLDLRWQDERPHIGDWLARKWWNPLTDDGDALRLAGARCLAVSIVGHSEHHQSNETIVLFEYADGTPGRIKQPHGDDRMAATRRAIVRAAAASMAKA